MYTVKVFDGTQTSKELLHIDNLHDNNLKFSYYNS